MGKQLSIVLFPGLAHGHMIPILDMAKLFISRNVKTTIISTPAFSDPIIKAPESGIDIGLRILNFPPEGSDLPDYIISLDQMTRDDLVPKFINALYLLQEPLEKILDEIKPNALISDVFFPWTVDSAAKFGVPRLLFPAMSNIGVCAKAEIDRHKPYQNVSSESESFVVPDLPHKFSFIRSQVSPLVLEKTENGYTKLFEQIREATGRSYGVVFNSFYELESDYIDQYRNILGKRTWQIGPLLLANRGRIEEKVQRGKKSSIDQHECLSWLDSKMHSSVVYMCFGSMATFTAAQLRETAMGLEASGQYFIWVIRLSGENEDWLPKEFEERTKEKGLIIRGWAPQLMILDHPSIGAFVTHCGWNSILEGVCAGVPMVTWPLFAEQFYNEKLVVEVLRIGLSVGNKKWMRAASEGVSSNQVARAVKDVIMGEEAEVMRIRAKNYKVMSRKAFEEGGSSYKSLNALIEELNVHSQME